MGLRFWQMFQADYEITVLFSVSSNVNISISKSNRFSLFAGQNNRPLDNNLDSLSVMSREERLITGHDWLPVLCRQKKVFVGDISRGINTCCCTSLSVNRWIFSGALWSWRLTVFTYSTSAHGESPPGACGTSNPRVYPALLIILIDQS